MDIVEVRLVFVVGDLKHVSHVLVMFLCFFCFPKIWTDYHQICACVYLRI